MPRIVRTDEVHDGWRAGDSLDADLWRVSVPEGAPDTSGRSRPLSETGVPSYINFVTANPGGFLIETDRQPPSRTAV
jgi:hypothetical protein